MTTTEVIEILTTHNAWRRGEDIPIEDMIRPEQLGKAIDEAVRLLKSMEIDELMGAATDCCPMCGSEDIVTSIYCNKCKEVM